jgi:malic enzyme
VSACRFSGAAGCSPFGTAIAVFRNRRPNEALDGYDLTVSYPLEPPQPPNHVFPAVGLAVYATKASRVTDEMFVAAAQAVAECVTSADLDLGQIYPPQSEIFETELHVAARIAEVIFRARVE